MPLSMFAMTRSAALSTTSMLPPMSAAMAADEELAGNNSTSSPCPWKKPFSTATCTGIEL